MSGNTRRALVPLAVAVLTVIGIVIGIRLCVYPPREPIGPPDAELPATVEGGPEVVFGRFVGHLRSHIVERFGPPSQEGSGYYGNRPFEYRWRFWGAETWTYDRPSGTLFLSFIPQGDDWVCFDSAWLPQGGVF